VSFFLLHIFILNNFVLLSRDMIYGDFSAASISPTPRYPFFRIPTSDYQGLNRLGVDFAQVYFPSKQFSALIENYSKGAFDPLGRPSRYAPFIHYLCAISICKFAYGYAAFLHMLIQLTLFYISLYAAFRILDLKKYLWPCVLLINFCLFLTPVGITWFERGQFSLYVALAYLWILLGRHTRNPFYVLLSALFAFVKWTSLPFIFVILALDLVSSKDLHELKRSILFGGLFAMIFVLLSLPFYSATRVYLTGLYQQELTLHGKGLSLMIFLPKTLVKILPFMLIVPGWLATRRLRKAPLLLVPFFAGTAILLITYPTLAYDYSVPVLMGFIPLMMAWAKLPATSNGKVNTITVAIFFIFLLAVSFSKVIQNLIPFDDVEILIYALLGMGLVCLPLLFPTRQMLDSPV